jgi:hypothetical protein
MQSARVPLRFRRTALRAVAAGVGLGFLLGFPLLAQPAFAGPEAGTQVEFEGGGSGPLCGSKPNRPTVTIKSESKVVFVNNLGQGAMLQIDGANGGPLSDRQAVEVQFRRGPVAIAMIPDCLNSDDNGSYEPVTVNVTSPSQASGGALGAPWVRISPKPKPSVRTAPTASADPSSEGPLFPPDPEGSGSAGPTGDTLESGSTAVTPNGDSAVDLTTMSDTPKDKGPIGLLAIIATVCVVGVAVGAIRAIVSQRATRTEFAYRPYHGV